MKLQIDFSNKQILIEAGLPDSMPKYIEELKLLKNRFPDYWVVMVAVPLFSYPNVAGELIPSNHPESEEYKEYKNYADMPHYLNGTYESIKQFLEYEDK